QPLFVEDAAELIATLKQQSVNDIAKLMKLSDALAQLNVERYAAWQPKFDLQNSRQAMLAFNGDVYEGLDASSLSDAQLKWSQDHIIMLSGLYGALRPLDLMQPYRLEMGTRLPTKRGKDLYEFWGDRTANYLNERLDDKGDKKRVILNLASKEYFKSVIRGALQARVVQCVFQDYKNDAWKVISFHAKRARGLMARYIVEHRIDSPGKALFAFDREGYAYAPDVSTPDKLVFR